MAKHPDLKTSNFSLLNASNSQVLGTPDSLSLPHEHPDIRNWFSSYVYESPELNTGDDFEGCGSFIRSDCEKEGSDVEDDNKKEEEKLGEFRRLVEKDELISDERLASDGFINAKNSLGDNKYASKVFDSSNSLPLSSEMRSWNLLSVAGVGVAAAEPPDIKNWFSSYVYESPTLDSSDFEVSDFKESKLDRGTFDSGKSKNEKDEKHGTGKRDELVGGGKIALNGSVKFYCSVEDNQCGHQYVYKNFQGNHQAVRNKNSSVLIDLPFGRISEQDLEGKGAQNHDIPPTKNVEKSSFDGDDFTEKWKRTFSQEASHRSLNANNSSGNNGGKSPIKLLHRRASTEESSEAKGQMKDAVILPPGSSLDLIAVNGDMMIKKPTGGSNGKENEGNIFAENGFISTRKSRCKVNEENSLKRACGSMKNRDTISAGETEKGAATLRRKVLSERTNYEHTGAMEIAGKWRCPQKSKPNLGPPLKQLRLEQWVHRV